MKKVIFFAAISLLLGATLIELIRDDTGYMLISISDKTVEMSFWVGISVLLFTLAIIFITIKLITYTWMNITGSISFITKARHRNTEQKFNQGLVHYIEGNWAVARKELLSSAKSSANPLINYLAAARSAFEMGDRDATYEILNQAKKISPENDLAIIISQARIQLQGKQFEQCLATLERADNKDQNHPVIIDLKRQTLWHVKDWPALIELLPKIKKNKCNYDIYEFETCIYLEDFNSQAKNLTTENSEKIHILWQNIPKKIKTKHTLITAYAIQLFRLRRHEERNEELMEFIKNTLAKEWLDELVDLYGQLTVKDKNRQLLIAEQWLKTQKDNPILLHALGKIAIANTLWDKAKGYLEASLAIEEKPELYADLAQLMIDMNDEASSHVFNAKGLTLYMAKYNINKQEI